MKQSLSRQALPEESLEPEGVLAQVLSQFKGEARELIPMLQKVQGALGYLSEESLLEIARFSKVPAATVFGVATFYAQFRLQPVGKHIVRVCRGTACHVRGSDRILMDIESQFDVSPGGTTKDGLFTIETVACFGSCALAPVMLVGDSVYGRLNTSKARKILKNLQDNGVKPQVDESASSPSQE
jgi:NADH-quinone oxidoreductase subunit E